MRTLWPRRRAIRNLIAALGLAGGIHTSATRLFSQSSAELVDYDREIHTILAHRCLSCHSQERRSGGLSLAAYGDILNGGRTGAAVKPGRSADSLMVARITGAVAPQMPLGQAPLNETEIATIRAWVDQGARPTPGSPPAKTRWEAPLTVTAPPLPAQTWKAWTDPVDRFTAVYLAGQGVAEPALVSDAEFARRAWLDVWGLLPTPQELHEFVADPRPGKRQQLAATLLADNSKYAENWISYWNDLLRNDEGVAYYSETANRKSITPWLLQALETNEPYDRWIRQLLDPTKVGDPDGFLTGVNWRGTVSASQTPALQAAQNSAQIFLGINLKCNSCHDSFISKWKLKDAYGLASYFSKEEKLELYRCDVAQHQFVSASFLYPELNRPPASMSVADRRAAAVEIFTDPRNGRMPRTLVNRIWERLMGHGLVDNVDDLDGEPWSPELLDWLASDFVESGYDLKHLVATIIGSRTYQLASVARAAEPSGSYQFRGPELRRLTAEEFADAVASITGDWRITNSRLRYKPATGEVPASGLAIISGAPADASGVADPPPPPAPSRTAPPQQSPPPPPPIPPGNYTREWRLAANSLTRALGRPIRDQVYSTRDTQPTTIQALELVNGETLTHWLWRGARRMLGELPPEPRSLFSRQIGSRFSPVPFDIDISQAQKLYLIVEDSLSTAPDKAAPIWLNAVFTGPAGETPLTALTPLRSDGLREGTAPVGDALRVKLSSVLVFDIAGKGFTRFRGLPAMENVVLGQGEGVNARFFVFDSRPSLDRLVPPNPEAPLPPGPVLDTIPETVDRVYWYALGRAPSAAERQIAEAALQDDSHPGHPSADGLADLLWAVMMTPEFQLIR